MENNEETPSLKPPILVGYCFQTFPSGRGGYSSICIHPTREEWNAISPSQREILLKADFHSPIRGDYMVEARDWDDILGQIQAGLGINFVR